jgi:hypothetical protein
MSSELCSVVASTAYHVVLRIYRKGGSACIYIRADYYDLILCHQIRTSSTMHIRTYGGISMILPDILSNGVRLHPSRPALRMDGKSYSYAEMVACHCTAKGRK